MPTPYTTLADVQARFPHLTFSAASQPTEAQVGIFIDDVSAEIYGILRAGYVLPVDAAQLAYLRPGASAGAAALVDLALGDAQDDEADDSPWAVRWEEFKEELRNQGLPGAARRGIQLPGFFYSAAEQPEDPMTEASGASSFLELTDTPASFLASRGVFVNADGDAVIFREPTTDDIDGLGAFVDGRVTTGGTGNVSANYVADAAFNTTTNRLTLTISNPPTSVNIGDGLLFVAPNNITTSDDPITITVTGSGGALDTARNLLDLDLSRVAPVQLLPRRLYEITRIHDATRSGAISYFFKIALALSQVVPTRRVTLSLSESEVRNLDTDYHELVAAPGAGRIIEISRWFIALAGTGDVVAEEGLVFDSNSDLVPTPGRGVREASIGMFFTLPAAAGMPNPLYGRETSTVARVRGLLSADPFSGGAKTGAASFIENQPLMYGAYYGRYRSELNPNSWPYGDATNWDDGIVNVEKTIDLTVDYSIHDFGP